MVDSRHGKAGTATLAARHRFRCAAYVAVFDHRSGTLPADLLRLASLCAAVLRTPLGAQSAPPQGLAARNLRCLSHGRSLVCRQLLLDLPDHAVLRRAASVHFGRYPDCLQSDTGALLRRLRSAAHAYGEGVPQLPLRTPGCAIFLGSPGSVVGPAHQGSMGFARLLANR